jgi:type IV secretion system protein TrbE
MILIQITSAIAVLGILLLTILFLRIIKVNDELKLKKHRSKEIGMADLLVYSAEVADGIIVGKNGSFMASWLYEGSDNASSTEEQRELISAFINKAFTGLGNGWMIHVDAVRRSSLNYSNKEESFFPDEICAAIDEERRQLFENLGNMYEGFFVISITYFPPMLAERKFIELMFDDDSESLTDKAETNNMIKTFSRECSNIESHLSSAVKLTRLKTSTVMNDDGSEATFDDFLSWLHFCVTGISQPIRLPNTPVYLDSLIGGQELWTGTIPKIGHKLVQVVAIEGFPAESTPGMLTILSELPSEYRWSSRFIFLDSHEAISQLEKYRKKWKQKLRGFADQVFNTNSGTIDQDAMLMVQDAESAIAEINSGAVAQGYYTSLIVIMDEDREKLEKSSRMVEKAINKLGFAARIETINTMDAYLGSLPGHGVENVRRPLINTLNLADLLPTSSIWTGEEHNPCNMYPKNSPALMNCVTQGATPFRLNLHVSDLGHTLMFGPTKNGKSTHLALLAAQLRRYKDMSVFAFDKGMSLYALTASINASTKGKSGKHFTIGSDSEKLAFCPLQFLDTNSDRVWAANWIDTILNLNGLITTPAQRNEIANAIMSMHESKSKTLSEFSVTIQDSSIREAIKQYTVDGLMGYLLDAETDGLDLSDFTVFEIEELLNLGEKYTLPVLLYLFRRIECSLHGQPSAIILDEAWIMLGHAVFREKIREWLKVLRKANCMVILATQSLTDAANSGILDVLVESTATKIFLPNSYARDDETALLYRRMGLNNQQINIITSAIPKRQYYYVSDNGRRLYELALGPLGLAFCATSDKESIIEIQKLEKKYGYDWVNHFLKSKQLDLKNYRTATI